MMFKGLRIYSVILNKCPRCQQGDFFIYNNPYKLKYFAEMHKRCKVCGESFERETGFYFGAMYASYGVTVFYGLLLFMLFHVLLKLDVWYFLIFYSLSILILLPVIYRVSRRIWISIFVGPHKDIDKKKMQ